MRGGSGGVWVFRMGMAGLFSPPTKKERTIVEHAALPRRQVGVC